MVPDACHFSKETPGFLVSTSGCGIRSPSMVSLRQKGYLAKPFGDQGSFLFGQLSRKQPGGLQYRRQQIPPGREDGL